jgi:hypothetical protein
VIEEVSKAANATTDHAYVAVRAICFKSKASVRPFNLAVKRLGAGG